MHAGSDHTSIPWLDFLLTETCWFCEAPGMACIAEIPFMVSNSFFISADVMRSLGVGEILAVDVGSQDQTDLENYGDSLSGFWVLWRRMNPFKKPIRVRASVCLVIVDMTFDFAGFEHGRDTNSSSVRQLRETAGIGQESSVLLLHATTH